MLLALIAAIATAGFVYFTLRWLQVRRGYSALSTVERRRAEVASIRGEVKKAGFRERMRQTSLRLGLGDNPFPLYAATVLTYLVVLAPLSTAVSVGIAFVLAVPIAMIVGRIAIGMIAKRRRVAFNIQMVDLLELTVSQIQGGVGAERALQIVVPQLQDPMRSEMSRALASGQAGKDLVGAMRELSQRYPSRAFDMFVAALEIDQAEGHAIAPALAQAATLLKQDFTLAAEAKAKLAQVKYEFYAVAGIVTGIAVLLITSSEPEMQEAYKSSIGIAVLALAIGNGLWGFYRFRKRITALVGDA